MGRNGAWIADASQIMLQEAIDASDVIGRWRWDVPHDRVYADALVALVFNVDPVRAADGAPISLFLDGVHPEDRARTARLIRKSVETGLRCVMEYRVRSADGVIRWILDRGRIALDEAGCPQQGSGVLIDITARRHHAGQDPLERAVDHCLAARNAMRELPEPLLHRMSDMLLLEIGMTLGRLARGDAGRPVERTEF